MKIRAGMAPLPSSWPYRASPPLWSDDNPLDLVERNPIVSAVIELGGLGRGMDQSVGAERSHQLPCPALEWLLPDQFADLARRAADRLFVNIPTEDASCRCRLR